MLTTARSRAQGVRPGTVLCRAVVSFAHLPVETRHHLLHGLHWGGAGKDWVEFVLDQQTLDFTRQARLQPWTMSQTILAACAWFLAACGEE